MRNCTEKCRVKTSSIETVMDVTARNKRMWQKSHHTKPHHSVMDVTEFGNLNCPELHTHSKKWRVKTSSNETVMDVTARNNRMWQSFCYGHDGNKRLETALSYSDTHKRNRDKTRRIEIVRDVTDFQCLWLIEPSWIWQSFCYRHDINKRWETALS